MVAFSHFASFLDLLNLIYICSCEEEEDEYEDMSEDDASSGTMGGRSDDEVNDDDDLASLDREETKSRFTEFSMSSSVLPRNDQLTLLDDRFEQVLNISVSYNLSTFCFQYGLKTDQPRVKKVDSLGFISGKLHYFMITQKKICKIRWIYLCNN